MVKSTKKGVLCGCCDSFEDVVRGTVIGVRDERGMCDGCEKRRSDLSRMIIGVNSAGRCGRCGDLQSDRRLRAYVRDDGRDCGRRKKRKDGSNCWGSTDFKEVNGISRVTTSDFHFHTRKREGTRCACCRLEASPTIATAAWRLPVH